MSNSIAKSRISALRWLLENTEASSQEDLREALQSLNFAANQSTISRDLRRIGAIKSTDTLGRTTYRILPESFTTSLRSLTGLIRGVFHNDSLIVLKTDPGSAPLIARHIDSLRSKEVLGTIAGDDTIFVAPSYPKRIPHLIAQIEQTLAL